ncbi:MAG: preprotein translocase subunit YajC [Nitrospirae bacterium CG18_big_fil_WC_8_21_14_2_50_70_55]|nr:preprotein translocase subunit YajC [Deltaproteobacteria bacterium]NCS73062.1 preprotein translocase subunit YajC [Deltaproteobacteria bacterium]PIQ06651.1 MAG: preprotein translocase subunit YajC [Nitrospirae bacterium CG18_big_fil_WC_8_21_14_2_50_70_55]PIW84046.1 MAG: preprotein translocase subunit YajC [Nitrospirae bacterium CG_4_8_14_3_um_filter_70_85]
MFELIANAAPAGGGTPSAMVSMVPLVLMFVIFYFLLIRPQQHQQKSHKQMLQTLAKGDRVVTSGGIHGQVTEVKGETLVVAITDSVRVKVDRSAIAQKLTE